MSKKRWGKNGEFTLATAISLTLWAAQLNAQERQNLEEVIVTGSLIEGTPEDAALPVEVITMEDLDNLGRPSNIDLVKTMSEVGQSIGEANRYNLYPVGAATVNLRNLGSRFTTVIFNGRRFPEQYSVATGRFNNISWIPNAAIGRIEVLKEGGAATYGADAIGGVVNYITRRDFAGLEVNADYRYIDGSDGDYTADVLWGAAFDRGSALMVAGYQHRSKLQALEREWSQTEFLENRSLLSWSGNGSPGSYIFTRPVAGVQSAFTPTTVTGSDVQMSGTGIVRDPSCTALGGFPGWSATPSPVCYFKNQQFENLVEESDSYQFYAETNLHLTDNLEFHGEALYYQLDSPDIANAPSEGPTSWPLVNNGPGRQVVGVSPSYFVDGHNPAVADFLRNRLRDSDGSTVYSAAQIDQIINTGRAALAQNTWRPFANGGNPLSGQTDIQHNNTKMYRLTAGLNAPLPEFWGTELKWDVAVTYSRVDYRVEANDILVDKLQAALNGLGGANCNNIRADLPGSTCQWFNPFGTAIDRNVYTGQRNPDYVAGLANDPGLVRWMYTPLWLDREYNYIFADAVVSGTTPLKLPGGPVAMAIGAQYRYTDEEFLIDALSNEDINPCPTIGTTNCTNRTSVYVYGRNGGVLGTSREPKKRYYPVIAAFAEAQLPILPTLNMQLAGRYERFYSDVTDRDNEVFVPAAALRWQTTPWLALRTSAGRTFSQVNPPEDDGPTTATAGQNNLFGGITGYETANYDNVDIKPEKGSYLSAGVLIDVGRFSLNADYFDIRVDDYTRTLTVNNVLRALVGPGTVTIDRPINCSSGLLNPVAGLDGRPFVELAEPCTSASTLGSSIREGARINYFGGTGQTNSGELKTTGIDLAASYRFDLFGGELRPSIDATYNLEYELDNFVVAGVPVAAGYEGVGFKNGATGRLNIAVPEWRGSIGVNFSRGRHTVNLLARYIPSVENEDPTDFDASNDQNANIGNAGGTATTGTGAATACAVPGSGLTSNIGDVPAGSGTGQYGAGSIGANGQPLTGATAPRGFCGNQNVSILSGETIASTTNLDLTYRVELPSETSLSFTVYNLTNERPSFDRAIVAYNAGYGSPLERNFKMALRKRF